MKIIKHIRVPLTVVSVIAVTVLMSAAATASSVKAAAPTGTTLAASNVTSTTVTLNGSVNPGGLATTTWFQWSPPGRRHQHYSGIGSGTTARVAPNITGLIPSRPTHSRLRLELQGPEERRAHEVHHVRCCRPVAVALSLAHLGLTLTLTLTVAHLGRDDLPDVR